MRDDSYSPAESMAETNPGLIDPPLLLLLLQMCHQTALRPLKRPRRILRDPQKEKSRALAEGGRAPGKEREGEVRVEESVFLVLVR